MFRIVGLQIAGTALVAVIAWAVGGGSAAVSALLGGAACFVPNGLFALRLAVASRRPGGADAATFFVGEFVKLGSTVALLALAIWAYRDMVWLALVASIVVTLKSYLVALAWR
ncbi:MAG: ATP synthase subunit I [Betaproteobacteria bacterium]